MDWGKILLLGTLGTTIVINAILHPITINIIIAGLLLVALNILNQPEVQLFLSTDSNIENKST